MTEITFIIEEDPVDGGFVAKAHAANNRDIFTEGDSREELIDNIREAIEASFAESEPKPSVIHLHFVRDEVIAR